MSSASPDSAAPAHADHDGGEIVARAGRYYRNARYLMTVLFVGAGLWFAYDGWVGYPKHNARVDAGEIRETKHTDTDIRLQRILGVALPVAGVLFLCWALYNSRGAYRLSGDTLHVPGHPPIPLDQIEELDKAKWDKKGIAYVNYRPSDAPNMSSARLDDFVYQQAPTDRIVERIEKHLNPEGAGTVAADGAESETA
jgi:hypothetical protein